MIDETEKQNMSVLLAPLIARFGYQFMSPHYRFSIPKGWMPIFFRLCQQIDDALPPHKRTAEFFYWLQSKEKIGTGRFRCKFSLDHEIYVLVSPLISAAETATEITCAECGNPAELRSINEGQMLTLCEQCLNKLSRKTK